MIPKLTVTLTLETSQKCLMRYKWQMLFLTEKNCFGVKKLRWFRHWPLKVDCSYLKCCFEWHPFGHYGILKFLRWRFTDILQMACKRNKTRPNQKKIHQIPGMANSWILPHADVTECGLRIQTKWGKKGSRVISFWITVDEWLNQWRLINYGSLDDLRKSKAF